MAGGKLFVAYRDDAITSGLESGISVVRNGSNGGAVWSSRRDAFKSTDIKWDTRGTNGGAHIVENPSMFKHKGAWYLAFSGNNWDSVRYATGLAKCGSAPIPSARCKPIKSGVTRPYFGFVGKGGIDPYRRLPANHKGPGGLDVFPAADGSLRAVWHWWQPSNRSRHTMTGTLGSNSGGFTVS